MKNLNSIQKILYVIGMICFAMAMSQIFKGAFTVNTFFLVFCAALMMYGGWDQKKLNNQD